MSVKQKNLGILCIIIGSCLIVIFAGSLLIRFLGTILGFLILNYGLHILHIAPVSVLFFQLIEDVKRHFKRNN